MRKAEDIELAEGAVARRSRTSSRRGTKRVRVLILMGKRMAREGLSYILRADPHIQVVGESESLDEAPAVRPDVVVACVDYPETGRPEFAKRLSSRFGKARVLAIASTLDRGVRDRAEKVGAGGLSLMTSPSADLTAMVLAVAQGEDVPLPKSDASAETRVRVPTDPEPDPDRLLLARLTPREREILRVVAEGKSTIEVSQELSISALTVQSHVKSILAKLGVHSKIEAVRLVLRFGEAGISGHDDAARNGRTTPGIRGRRS
jgi:two-component system, NarL family, response regulator DevR